MESRITILVNFFRCSGNIDGNGRLYVMFADCSSNWSAIDIMQSNSEVQ